MKKIIIAGVCLVTGAIVYGFVDYLKTDKKQLQRMYGDEPAAGVAQPVAPATMVAAEIPAPAVVVQPASTSPDNTSSGLNTRLHRKKVDLELYSRASLEEKYITPDSTALIIPVVKKPDAPTVQLQYVQQPKNKIAPPSSTFKKLNLSSFSRSSLKRKVVVADTVAHEH